MAADRPDEAGAERIAELHAALAAAQDRSYWLDRWQVDLNALMRRRGASELRAGLRAIRAVYRHAYRLRSIAGALPQAFAERLRYARGTLEREREAGATAAPVPWAGRLAATPVTDRIGESLDGEDLAALAGRARADALLAVLAEAQIDPQAGGRWRVEGAGSEPLAAALSAAYPDLEVSVGGAGAPADVAFSLVLEPDAGEVAAAVERLSGGLAPAGRLALATPSGSPPTGALLAALTPGWTLLLLRPGGLDGDRDVYVLARR